VVPETPEPVEKVRPISAVLAQDLFNEEAWQLARFVADRYLCHQVEALYLVLPPGTSSGLSLERRVEYVDLLLPEQEARTLVHALGRGHRHKHG